MTQLIVSQEIALTLLQLAAKRRVSISTVIAQAVGTELYIAAVQDEGGAILIKQGCGSIRQLVPR